MLELVKSVTFIVLSGPDGCGKTTQTKLLAEALQKRFGPSAVITSHEPGGSPRAENLRRVILDPQTEASSPLHKMLLFFAARDDHVRETIAPALKAGKIFVSDRYDESSFIYQCWGEAGGDWRLLQRFHDLRSDIEQLVKRPDRYLILEVDKETARQRLVARKEKLSYFDAKGPDFQDRLRQGCRAFVEAETNRGINRRNAVLVDGMGTIEEVHVRIMAEVQKLF